MNVLIVEDESLAAERLEKLLKQYDPSINILYQIDTVNDAAVFMDSHRDKLDLVFLDIQLADGKSFEIFNKITYNKPVIFTTAYDQYALNAFKVNSIDYLLKPIKLEELEAALNKYKEVASGSNSSNMAIDSDLIKSILHSSKEFKQRFLVKYGNKIQFKNVEDAAFFSAEDKICHLHSYAPGKKYLIDHTLEELESQLLDPEKFFRINRQYILNIDSIKEVRNDNQRLTVILKTGSDRILQVSKTKTSEFKAWLDK